MHPNIIFKQMSIDDVVFLNNIRNKYAEEYLHDSRTFSIDETIEWFEKVKPNYLIVYNNNIKIGYVRLSNYSHTNNNIMVGMDIAPEFTNMGYGQYVYKKLIPYLFKEYSLNKLSLEVLSTNKRAIHLYEKVGFKHEGVKRQDVYKKGEYVDSILMSILKSEL